MDFQNRLISKLGDEESVKCGNAETFSSKKDFNEKVFSSDKTLYYFYDSVSYADGNKPFGVEEYKKMGADSSKFDFPTINYNRIFYDGGLSKYIDDSETDDLYSAPYVTQKNSPLNFAVKSEKIRDIFEVEDDGYYYSLNYSLYDEPAEANSDSGLLDFISSSKDMDLDFLESTDSSSDNMNTFAFYEYSG